MRQYSKTPDDKLRVVETDQRTTDTTYTLVYLTAKREALLAEQIHVAADLAEVDQLLLEADRLGITRRN